MWDLEDDSFMGYIELEGASSFPAPMVEMMAFNADPDLEYIAIAYLDGELAVNDIWGQLRQSLASANATALATSLDGKTLTDS